MGRSRVTRRMLNHSDVVLPYIATPQQSRWYSMQSVQSFVVPSRIDGSCVAKPEATSQAYAELSHDKCS